MTKKLELITAIFLSAVTFVPLMSEVRVATVVL